ncbi:MAG: metallophosphoesterase [Actinomycetota bacterium]
MSPAPVVQLSDTHFLEPGAEAEGGGAYDTAAAFEAVLGDVERHLDPDLVVVTGDVADHGRPEQYRLAADSLGRFAAPVNVCPGNHDRAVAFDAGLGRADVSTTRVIELGAWALVFADSCAGVQRPDEHGLPVDPPVEERLHSNGSLGSAEASWIRRVVEASPAEHVFVWLHHPPVPGIAMYRNDDYLAEWRALLADLPKVRGLGAGHTHVPAELELDGRPIFVAPSLKNNFDLEAGTWLPPGYRSYRFHDDGTVESEVHLVDGDAWPRRPLGRALRSLFAGEISMTELMEIVERRAAERGG